MRIALLLLVAANLLAFAWGQGWLAPVIGEVRQPERLERQVGPERLRVLRRDDPHPKERVVAGRVESDESRRPSRPSGAPARAPAPGTARAPAAAAPPAREASAPREPDARIDAAAREDAPTVATGAPGRTAQGRGSEAGRLEDAPGAASTGIGRAADGAADLGLRDMARPSPARSPADAAMPAAQEEPAGSAAAAPGADPAASKPPATPDAETPRAAPSVPFGLAEPPITAALTSDPTRLARAAAGVAPPSGEGPDDTAAAVRSARSPAADAGLPGNLETGAWPAPVAVARAAQACFDLRGLDTVRAAAVRDQLEDMGATSIEERAIENRSGFIVFVPASETVEQAQARIEQLRAQGVRDTYLVMDGTYRLAISLGVFNRRDSAEQLEREVRARGVEDARIDFLNPAATRVTLRVRGPEDLLGEAQVRAVANLRDGQLARCP